MSNRKRCRAEKCRQPAVAVCSLPDGVHVGLCGPHAKMCEWGIIPPLKPHKSPLDGALR